MPLTLVDTNVLLDVINADPAWVAWSAARLTDAIADGSAAINPVVYAEVAAAYDTPEALDAFLPSAAVRRVDFPWSAAFPASRAHLAYRRRGGTRTGTLADFLIGAHAEVVGMRLLTRDVARYRTYFPGVELIHPGAG